jgi:hypothetical protein
MRCIQTDLSRIGLGLQLNGWRYCNRCISYDALNDKQIQGVLVSWFTSLPRQSTRGLLQLAEYFGGSPCERTLPASWSLQTSGHFVAVRTSRSAKFAKVA